MDNKDLKSVASKMAKMDMFMMLTKDGRGTTHARPMSNNGEVEYDGNNYFFTYLDSGKVRQLRKNSKVTLIFQSPEVVFIEVCGRGKVSTDKKMMQDMWYDGLKQWFPQGLETPGIAVVQVIAEHIHFWDKGDEGVIIMKQKKQSSRKKVK